MNSGGLAVGVLLVAGIVFFVFNARGQHYNRSMGCVGAVAVAVVLAAAIFVWSWVVGYP